MSKIQDAKGRRDGNSGYTRVLGNNKLGQLLSRVQATLISNGTELEKLISDRCNIIDNLDNFIDNVEKNNIIPGVYLLLKKNICGKYTHGVENIKPDMLIFICNGHRVCKIIELKEGDMFDTKKSKGEKNNLENFTRIFGSQVPFSTEYFICSFNQDDKNIIYNGFKQYFPIDKIFTGRDLCNILNINYEDIINLRTRDMEENLNYFIDELLGIDEIRILIEKTLLEKYK